MAKMIRKELPSVSRVLHDIIVIELGLRVGLPSLVKTPAPEYVGRTTFGFHWPPSRGITDVRTSVVGVVNMETDGDAEILSMLVVRFFPPDQQEEAHTWVLLMEGRVPESPIHKKIATKSGDTYEVQLNFNRQNMAELRKLLLVS